MMQYGSTPPPVTPELPMGLSEKNYLGLMNLIFLAPFGWIVSLVLWIMGREKSAKIDVQGKYIINWLITTFVGIIGIVIVGMILGILFRSAVFLVTIMFILYGGIILYALICPIIGGIKGLNGETWQYPLSIRILK